MLVVLNRHTLLCFPKHRRRKKGRGYDCYRRCNNSDSIYLGLNSSCDNNNDYDIRDLSSIQQKYLRRSIMSFRILLLFVWTSLTFSFQPPTIHPKTIVIKRLPQSLLLRSQVSDDFSVEADFLQDAEILEFSMQDHRPLGCTVEESLGKRYGPLIFCSKVTPSGFADQAGIKPGDVLLGLSGMFGGIEDVTKAGIDRVRALVGACPDDEPLVVRLARGTPVLADHEEAVVDLCSNPGSSDSDVDECVTDFLRGGYYTEGEDAISDDATGPNGDDNDNDNLLDDMFNMWAEDLPTTSSSSTVDADAAMVDPTSKPKPWSSRSSPSGTFVRDPRTGKMTNIDT